MALNSLEARPGLSMALANRWEPGMSMAHGTYHSVVARSVHGTDPTSLGCIRPRIRPRCCDAVLRREWGAFETYIPRDHYRPPASSVTAICNAPSGP